ncbi:MAG TPA: hypothetical protein VGP47_06785, partial [Parachlamydiaceae bacterium]|nr:hypothetical protein [Parachlamydiaceae bacterium]
VERIAKISKKVQDDLAKITPSFRFNQEKDVGSYITHLTPGIIYDHAIKMSECANPRVKDWALYLLFKAAEKGSLEALNKLGSLILNKAPELNFDQDCDQKIGIKFLKESAKHGNVEALMSLGFHHLKGNGVKQDIDKALGYYTQAHDIGHADAFSNMSFIRKEILRSTDPKKAALTLSLVSNNPRE